MAVLSKGINLYFCEVGEANLTDLKDSIKAGTANPLTNLQEIPDLGGESEAIEITTLADAAHTYMNGLISYGDSLEFKFLYEKEQFGTLEALVDNQQWLIMLPDGVNCAFEASCSVRFDGVGTNTALTYTLALKPQSEMIWDFGA